MTLASLAGNYGSTTWESQSVKVINDFLAMHEDELGTRDYEAMLEYELGKKKPRTTVVRELKALIGEA